MKTVILLTGIFWLLVFACAELHGVDITIPDPNLELAIRAGEREGEGMEGPNIEGPITDTDMALLIRINAFDLGITDLTGLEHAINLTNLGLGENLISDISPLAALTKLEKLDLYGNQISDISALSGLIELVELTLERNQISDISQLAGLTNLSFLDLTKNQISDITPSNIGGWSYSTECTWTFI